MTTSPVNTKYVIAPETLIQAYALGVFPMAEDAAAGEIHFYEPDIRGVIPLAPPHIPKRLLRTLKQRRYDVRWNSRFVAVIDACAAPSAVRPTTWINAEIRRLFIALHHLGFAHSVEVFDKDMLVGGLYGLRIGQAFFGESMFSHAANASKIALCHLIGRLVHCDMQLLDAQFSNDHLKQFGLLEMPRAEFHKKLQPAIAASGDLQFAESEEVMLYSLMQAVTDRS